MSTLKEIFNVKKHEKYMQTDKIESPRPIELV